MLHEQTLGEPVLRHIADSQAQGLVRGPNHLCLAVDFYLPRVRRVQAKKGKGQLGASGADQAGQSQYLPGMELEADVAELPFLAQSADFQQDLGLVIVLCVLRGPHLPAGHQLDELFLGQSSDIIGADLFPVPEYADAIGDLEDLVQLVADEQHGDAALLYVADYREQVVDVPLAEAGGGLIHDDELLAPGDGPADRHALLLGDGQLPHQCRGVEIRSDSSDCLLGYGHDLGAPHEYLSLLEVLVHGDVLRHAEVGEQ